MPTPPTASIVVPSCSDLRVQRDDPAHPRSDLVSIKVFNFRHSIGVPLFSPCAVYSYAFCESEQIADI